MTPARFPKFAFFRNPSVAPRMGLGDHLMTIRVLAPMGTHVVATGPSSPSHGPPKSFKTAVCRWFNGLWCEHKLQFSTLYRSKMENSIAFGKPTSQRIYSKPRIHKIGKKRQKYGLKYALHSLDGHFRWSQYQKTSFENFDF